MTDDKIRYSDIIQPDDSIEKLIRQLSELSQSYKTMVDTVVSGADKVARSLKNSSGATSEGRRAIDDAAAAASRLERAEKELSFALSEVGQKVAWVKAQTADANKVSVEQARQAKALAGSYEKIKLELNENVQKWKAMSDTQRTSSEEGERTLNTIIGLRTKLAELDAQLRPTIDGMAKLRKAEQELAFWQSEEGKQLAETNVKIREAKASYAEERREVDAVTRAAQNLTQARSNDTVLLAQINARTREANKEAKLTAQLNNSAVGSYNALAAQYELNKIKLNAMSGAQREATDAGKKLETETKAIYQQMIKLQEATGNHRLSVGHYEKAWDGLGMSVSAIVRELPSAAVSMNTFFLAISNNIPLLADEIIRLRAENAKAIASGKEGKSVVGALTGALFSWNTAMVLGVTALTVFGENIVEWAKKLIVGKEAVISTEEAIKNINEELENTNDSYGSNIVSLKKLQAEWKNLKTAAEKNQWIRDNQSEFNKLCVAVNNINDADLVFIKQTRAVIMAFKLRAQAAAAEKLAVGEYEKILKLQVEIEEGDYGDLGKFENENFKWFKGHKGKYETALQNTNQPQMFSPSTGLVMTPSTGSKADQSFVSRTNTLRDLTNQLKLARQRGDKYIDISAELTKKAEQLLKDAGIGMPHKQAPKSPKSPESPNGKEPRDLTDVINRNHIELQKRYEESVTELQADEFAKRRKEAADQIADENNKLREKYRKNEEYVNNVGKKYKELTEEQKAQIAQQQQWITKTLANNLVLLDKQLTQIANEQKIRLERLTRDDLGSLSRLIAGEAPLVTNRYSITRDPRDIEESLVKERNLLEDNLAIEYVLILEANKKLREEGDESARSEYEIQKEWQIKRLQLYAEYDNKILNLRQQNNENKLALVKKGSDEELELLLKQNEIAKQQALAENASKPAEEQANTADIIAYYEKLAKQISGTFELTRFDEAQATADAEFNIVKRNDREITIFRLKQEKKRWEKLIALAEAGALEWGDEQLAAAEATLKGINRQLGEAESFSDLIGDKGLGGALLTKLGFNDDQIAALEDATSVVLDNLSAIFEAEVEMAEKEVEMAKERAEATKSAYEAEIEARNNGYANNVATAKKEMQLAKKNQREKEKLLADAQRKQQAVDTSTQVSSLVTAAANIWSVFSKTNPFLAIATITTMFGSFAAAKIKAAQAAKASTQEYGEGGLEFLEGGSHASGNDIDLGTKNSRGKNMRAEGGEAMAIINKRSTRKYRKHLPLLIDSLNKGTFEDKYLRAFDAGENIQIPISNSSVNVDLSRLERDVTEIKKQNSTKYYNLNNGTTLVVKGNVKRYIR